MKQLLATLLLILGIVVNLYAQKDSIHLKKNDSDESKYKVVYDYLANQSDSNLSSPSSWKAINDYVYNVHSREFIFFIKNHKIFASLYGDSAVNEKISRTYLQNVLLLAKDTARNNAERFTELRAEIARGDFPKREELLAKADLFFYHNSNNWPKFSKIATSGVIEKYYWNKPTSLCKFAKIFYEHFGEDSLLQKAIKWSERSLVLLDSPEHNLIYAQLLSKVGEIDKAIKVQSHALDLAMQFHLQDLKVYEDELRRLKNQKK